MPQASGQRETLITRIDLFVVVSHTAMAPFNKTATTNSILEKPRARSQPIPGRAEVKFAQPPCQPWKRKRPQQNSRNILASQVAPPIAHTILVEEVIPERHGVRRVRPSAGLALDRLNPSVCRVRTTNLQSSMPCSEVCASFPTEGARQHSFPNRLTSMRWPPTCCASDPGTLSLLT